MVASVASCDSQSAKIERANAILKRQIAADVTVDIDQQSQKLYEPLGALYFVCGTGTVNQPGITSHERQRILIHVNTQAGIGLALFDGSRTAEGRAKFQTDWDNKCR